MRIYTHATHTHREEINSAARRPLMQHMEEEEDEEKAKTGLPKRGGEGGEEGTTGSVAEETARNDGMEDMDRGAITDLHKQDGEDDE